MVFPPGASQGAPLDGTTTGSGVSCCPPQLTPGAVIPVASASVPITAAGVNLANVVSVEGRSPQGSGAPVVGVNGFSYSPGVPGDSEALLLDLDTSAFVTPAPLMLVITNECGCQSTYSAIVAPS